MGERGHVPGALAEGREREAHYIEPVVEVQAEEGVPDRRPQVAGCRRRRAGVGRGGEGAVGGAPPLPSARVEGVVGEEGEGVGWGRGAVVAVLAEKPGPAVGDLELPALLQVSPGECPFLVAKQLRL